MDVRNDRDLTLFGDNRQRIGVIRSGDSDADDIAAGGGEFRNLLESAVDVCRLRRGHGLHTDPCVPADLLLCQH